MQCYTKQSKFPRTSLSYYHREPPRHCYAKRRHFIPEATKIGRPWCPDVEPYPFYFNQKAMKYNPLYEQHREKSMDEMIEHINVCNWMGGQDMRVFGPRRSKLSKSLKYSMQSTQRHAFQDPKLGKPALRNPQCLEPASVIAPCVYTARPYVDPTKHMYNLTRVLPEIEPTLKPGPATQPCQVITVQHFIPEPFPGASLPEDYHSKMADKREKVKKFGLVP